MASNSLQAFKISKELYQALHCFKHDISKSKLTEIKSQPHLQMKELLISIKLFHYPCP